MHEPTIQPPSAATITRGHESSEIKLRGFFIFLGALAALGIVTFAIVWALMVGLRGYGERRDPEMSPLSDRERPVIPPQPWLQPSPPQGQPSTDYEDLKHLRDHEERILNSYAIESDNDGRARIPIDRAMQLFIERQEHAASLPTTKPATTQSIGGVR